MKFVFPEPPERVFSTKYGINATRDRWQVLKFFSTDFQLSYQPKVSIFLCEEKEIEEYYLNQPAHHNEFSCHI